MTLMKLENIISSGVITKPARAIIDVEILKNELKYLKINKKDLWKIAKIKYGMDLEYKGFVALTNNKAGWKVEYALIVSDIIKVPIERLFILKIGKWGYPKDN